MGSISRRHLMGAALGGRLGKFKSQISEFRTVYIAAYDTESPTCLPACRRIVEVHKRLRMPATFFITGRTLEGNKPHVSLIWHPWSLHRFDPEMQMLELTFAHARKLGLTPCTYGDLLNRVAG